MDWDDCDVIEIEYASATIAIACRELIVLEGMAFLEELRLSILEIKLGLCRE